MDKFTYEKPYYTLTQYYNEKYGCKIGKIALNANFTCPNKDGKKGYGGCTYCSKLGSGDLAGDKNKTFKEQFDDIINIMESKWPSIKYMPYLQANSNTYDKLENLKNIYNEVLNIYPDKTVGISIATRADCIDEEIADYLGELNKITNVQIELGLQSSNENTGILINRCSTNLEFVNAVNLLRKYNIEIVVHIINGLPYENETDMINTINFINKLDIQGIKFHSLLILKETKIALQFEKEKFHILTLDEYVDITTKQIMNLRPDIVIHRLAADGVYDDLIAPLWTRKKLVVMNEIDKKLRSLNAYQGINYKGESK